MKAILLAPICSLAICCNQLSTHNDPKESIPGRYVYAGGTEFSKGTDTLTISPYNEKARIYVVLRKTGFNRIIDGGQQPKEYKTEKMVATYDETKQQLQDTKTGRLFSFNHSNTGLLFGTANYQKIK